MKNSVLKGMKKKDRIDFYISIPVILLMLVFVSYYSFTSADHEINNQHALLLENSQEISEVAISGTTFVTVENIEYRERISTPAKIENKLPPKNLYSQSSTKVDTNLLSSILKVEDEYQDSVVVVIDDSRSDSNEIVTPTQIDTEKSIDKAEISKNKTNQQDIDLERECIIILGAFGRQGNVTKLMDRLNFDGYDAFSTPHKGLTRVGVYQNCKVESLSKSLETIRNKYTKDAMVLTKSLQ